MRRRKLLVFSQIKSHEPAINIKTLGISSPVHRLSFWVTNFIRRNFSVPTGRF